MANSANNNLATPRSGPRGAHIVDALRGPLVGEDHLRRVLPFAATATIAMVIALPTSSWIRPGLAVSGSLVLAAAIIGAVGLPWPRVARSLQLCVPFLMLIGTLMLASATGNGIGSPFITMAVLPLMWLAIYENRATVLIAATMAGLTLWIEAPNGANEPSNGGLASTAVLMVCCAGMGVTLHGLVANARRLALTLRDQQTALEQGAAVLDALPERVSRYRVDDHTITYCNPAWSTQYKIAPADAIGRVLDDFLSEDEAIGLTMQLKLLGPHNPILVDTTPRATPGTDRQWLEWVDRYLIGDNGPEILSIGRDVTRRRNAELELADSEARFRDLADKSVDVVWRFSNVPTPHFDYMSPSVESILGYPPSYFLDDFSRISGVLDEAGTTAIARALNGEQVLDRFDFRFRHANGSIIVGETRTTPLRDGLQGVSRDVTELRKLQDNMAALALRDSLTGLANRRLFNELFDAALARTQRSAMPLALAFLDLDEFKSVNDVHGHDAGDLVLCETARRLLKVVRGADTIARLGGDEFVIVYEPTHTNSRNVIERIEHALSQPIKIEWNTEVVCPASIGVAHTATVGYDSAALLAAADKAMYEAKRARQKTKTRPSTAVETSGIESPPHTLSKC